MLLRTPVHPLFLATVYSIAGPSPRVAVFVQIILSMGTVFLIYYIGKRYLPERYHFLFAILLVIEPIGLAMTYSLYSETIFIFFLALTTYFFIRSLQQPAISFHLFVSGIFLGITILCRPIAQYLTLIFIIWYLVHKGINRLSISNSLIYLIGITIIVGPWIYRNYKVRGISTISIAGNYNLYYNVAVGTLIKAEGLNYQEARRYLKNLREKRIRKEDLTRYDQKVSLYNKMAKEIIFDHPFAFIRSTFNSFLITAFGGARPLYGFIAPRIAKQGTNFFSAFIHPQKNLELRFPPLITALVILDLLFICLLYAGMLFGVYMSWKEKQVDIFFFFLIAAYFILLASAPMGYSRYRHPSMPFVILTACYGFSQLSYIKNKFYFNVFNPSTQVNFLG